MRRKPASRKKARPAKRRRSTFTLTVEAQPMVVSCEPHWMRDVGHFEFRSPHKPPRRIPVSETGYRSYFASMADVEEAKSPQEFAREFVRAVLRSEQSRSHDPKQLALFQ
jgi:hypothetical protein